MERHAALPRAAAQSFGKAIAILRGLPDSASDARLGASLVSLAQVHRSLGRRGPMCADSSEALRIFQRTENGDTANDRYADSRKTALELAKRCGKR
jgi:hypothetical protein